jgi:hypothetical protein
MHYRNGREAKNGDKVIQLATSGTQPGYMIQGYGVLHSATAGNDYCNGEVASLQTQKAACLVDCIHVDDLVALLIEKGWDKRPAGK